MGKPEGPGMAVFVRDLERAHARPPGARRKAKTETKTMTLRKSGKVSTREDGVGIQRAGKEDILE